MYLPNAFEETRRDVLHALIRRHPLGLLVTQGASGLEANALPFLLDAERGEHGVLLAHVARANPVWRDARSDNTLVVFQGSDSYVSPGWYASKRQHGKVVPTWNYVMVQARGALRVQEDPAWLRQFVGALTTRHEADLPVPWAVEDAPADHVDSLLRAIVGIEIELTSLQGKWKVSQNRPAADRAGVADALAAQSSDKARDMAEQVRQPGHHGPEST